MRREPKIVTLSGLRQGAVDHDRKRHGLRPVRLVPAAASISGDAPTSNDHAVETPRSETRRISRRPGRASGATVKRAVICPARDQGLQVGDNLRSVGGGKYRPREHLSVRSTVCAHCSGESDRLARASVPRGRSYICLKQGAGFFVHSPAPLTPARSLRRTGNPDTFDADQISPAHGNRNRLARLRPGRVQGGDAWPLRPADTATASKNRVKRIIFMVCSIAG